MLLNCALPGASPSSARCFVRRVCILLTTFTLQFHSRIRGSGATMDPGQPNRAGGEEQDVRKILDELNLNRVNMENDRRAYDKVRLEIAEVDGNLKNVAEQLNSFAKKISELYESSASRSSDVNLFTVKNHVIEENCQKLEGDIEKIRDESVTTKRELIGLTSEMLESNVSFSINWNCSQSGREHRKLKQAAVLEDLVISKKNLEYEMDDFLLMQRNVDYAEAEKSELQAKFQGHEATIQEREVEIQQKILVADESYDQLVRQKQDPSKRPHGEELTRLSQKVDQQRASIKFWEDRVSETHRIFENQRKGNKGGTHTNLASNTVTNRLYQTASHEDPPVQSYESSQTRQSRGSMENINATACAPNEVSQYNFNGNLKAPRLFQFKKKSMTQAGTAESNSKVSSVDNLPGFQSTLAMFECKSEK